jgi:hypothetical protein
MFYGVAGMCEFFQSEVFGESAKKDRPPATPNHYE